MPKLRNLQGMPNRKAAAGLSLAIGRHVLSVAAPQPKLVLHAIDSRLAKMTSERELQPRWLPWWSAGNDRQPCWPWLVVLCRFAWLHHCPPAILRLKWRGSISYQQCDINASLLHSSKL